MPTESVTQVYAIFHLNLAFSSIDASEHGAVVERCYWPLLRLVEQYAVPLGIELTGYTLDCIARVDPHWIAHLRQLLQAGRCELIASGDSQIIGPLVPAAVNTWNLRLGQAGYERHLGTTPTLAYINEQAVSAGLLDCYIDAGFAAVVVEWDNPYTHHPEWGRDRLNRPQTLLSASGRSVKVIWNHAVAFQKFQRYVHGETTLDDYCSGITRLIGSDCYCFPLYGSDAEVFDYRPGRYQSEAVSGHREWQRIGALIAALQARPNLAFIAPHAALRHWRDETPLQIGTAAYPLSVKKQAKYNVTRWALSGRNDLALNTACYAEFARLRRDGCEQPESWQALCRLWASDLRTHLTASRYAALLGQRPLAPVTTAIPADDGGCPEGFRLEYDRERNYLRVESDVLRLQLNMNRGMSIISLAFGSQHFVPVAGTLFHGHFDHIGYSADFYSNHLVMERFRERDRVTDLTAVTAAVGRRGAALVLSASLKTGHGLLHKRYVIEGESLRCEFAFAESRRPEASLRLGFITLLDCRRRPWFASVNGGYAEERFNVDQDINHGAAVSSIVSAGCALGATTGQCRFGSGDRGLQLQWDMAACAALPMISSQQVDDQYLNRLWFSLAEADETLKPDGHLLPFAVTLRPDTAESIAPPAEAAPAADSDSYTR